MFSPAEVDELFVSTTRALQRSQVLLDERRISAAAAAGLPPTFCQPTTSAASTAIASSAASIYAHNSSSGPGSSSSTSFTETVEALQALGDFRGFVDATTGMHDRIVAELVTPSRAMQNRRGKAQEFALLQSVQRGLREATAAAAASWRTSNATASLWSGGSGDGGAEEGEGEGDEEQAGDSHLLSTGSSSSHNRSSFQAAGVSTYSSEMGRVRCSGSQVTASLLFGALCVDVALTIPRATVSVAAALRRIAAAPASQADSSSEEDHDVVVIEWMREGNRSLGALLREIAQLMPRRVAAQFVARVADLLFHPSTLSSSSLHSENSSAQSSGLRDAASTAWLPLSGGQCLYPRLNAYILEHSPSVLAARWFFQPLQATSQQLRATYYSSSMSFAAQCRWLLDTMFVLAASCAETGRLSSSTTSAASAQAASRHLSTRQVRQLQRLYDAWLMPLEKTFGHDAARHGMTAHVYTHLVQPHARLVQHLLTLTSPPNAPASANTSSSSTSSWISVLHTAQYRLLLVLEKMAQSEAAHANGTSSSAARQRTYEALLRQHGGKISLSLLQTLAEDKQRVLEETPSRSPDGHRLYRLHDGGGGATAVFIYVDDGALFMKVGRTRVFQRVKSVEDIFRPLE